MVYCICDVIMMLERIQKNEERLDSLLCSISNLKDVLQDFKLNIKNIRLVNNYYGSSNWFKDKKAYESNNISKIKAGVLSEDAVWNMLEDVDDIILEMKDIINDYEQMKGRKRK